MTAAVKPEPTLTAEEVTELADYLKYGGHLNFTNLANKQLVAKELRRRGVKFYSSTGHGSLLDPRYTVEGRQLPDLGLANDYRHFTRKLYVIDVTRY